ncbi:heme-binding protein, partial [Oleiphilus sp. HI0086]
VNDYTVAAIRFSGWLDEDTIESKKSELLAWLNEQDIKAIGQPIIAGYDPPSSIPFFRRNEVLIPIE